MNCPLCGAALSIPLPVSRREMCPQCKGDLHACRCCSFFEPGAHNDCREPQADRVVDNQASNFCDYFELSAKGAGARGESPKDKARAALDSIFKKK